MKKYLISVLGIGDLIFFCGTILLNHKKGETIEIHLSKNILKLYRDNSKEYEKFCYEYIKYFLEDYNLKILSDPAETNYVFEISSDLCQKVINNDEVRIIIQNKLNNTQSKYNNYIVIFTKVRDLNYDNFISSSKDFFNKINNFSGNIILLGEQEIKYTGEYAIHGKNLIYSIYDHCVKNIKPEKIIDLTTNSYDFSGFSLSNILKDCNIISNSTETYVFGGGGFFCLSLFTNKLVSLTNDMHKNIFYSNNNPRIFSDINKFNSY